MIRLIARSAWFRPPAGSRRRSRRRSRRWPRPPARRRPRRSRGWPATARAPRRTSPRSRAAPTPPTPRAPIAQRQRPDRARSAPRVALAPGPPAIENGIDAANRTSRTIETNTLRSCAWPASGAPGAVARVGIASAATASTSRVAIVRTGRRAEGLDAVPQPADEEGQAEDEQAVGQDRADERASGRRRRGPAWRREDRDEQLGQVAEGRLEDARSCPARGGGRAGRSLSR